MASWTDIAALAVATSQLAVVQDVINAIDNADRESAAEVAPPSFGPAATYECGHQFLAEPIYARRVVVHPEPRYEARPVIYPEPRVDQLPPVEATPSHSCITPSPIQPPWKVLPWQNPLPDVPKIKIVVRPPDISSKGTVLDSFL